MRTLFTGGVVVDGTGAEPAHADVVVEAGRIVDVGRDLDGDRAVDLGGRTLLPGLFDCHVHVWINHIDFLRHLGTPFSYRFYVAARNLSRLLDVGITTARDAGGADYGVSKAVDDGLIRGPRLRVSLAMLGQTGGHSDPWTPSGAVLSIQPPYPGMPSRVVDGVDGMRLRVRECLRAGAHQIKVAASGGVLSPHDDPQHAHLSLAELQAAVAEAEAAGTYVMAHAHGSAGIKNAIRAGVRSIEHGTYLDDEAIALMLEHGTFLVPTMMAPRCVEEAADADAAMPETAIAKARAVRVHHDASVRKAIEAGVRIAMGTDALAIPAGRNLEELEHYVGAGMTPIQAIRSATAEAAELLGLEDELGTIEPGKRADLVVVDGDDPLDLRRLGERVVAVWKDGAQVVGDALPVSG